MSRKKRGFQEFLSVVFSVFLLSFTLLFLDDFSDSLSGFASQLLSLSEQTELDVVSLSEMVITQEKTSANIYGFGSGTKTDAVSSDVTTPEDIKKIMNDAVPVYANLKKTGGIEETALLGTASTVNYGNVSVNNKTETKKVNVKNELSKKPSFGKITKEKPYILIYHTHTTEGYELLDKGWYSNDYNSRTKDTTKTVVRVGDEIAERLEKAGFKVIHDKTIYDASYNGAYSRSLETVEKYLEEYPSIVVTLDVHRDAIHYENGTKCKPTAIINGKKAAQVMIITGAEEGSVDGFPEWEKNLTFAIALQNKVEENYKGLMRPVFFCQRKYNMNVTPCSLLLEMGTDANTLDEAVYSGRLIGDSLAELLEENM